MNPHYEEDSKAILGQQPPPKVGGPTAHIMEIYKEFRIKQIIPIAKDWIYQGVCWQADGKLEITDYPVVGQAITTRDYGDQGEEDQIEFVIFDGTSPHVQTVVDYDHGDGINTFALGVCRIEDRLTVETIPAYLRKEIDEKKAKWSRELCRFETAQAA